MAGFLISFLRPKRAPLFSWVNSQTNDRVGDRALAAEKHGVRSVHFPKSGIFEINVGDGIHGYRGAVDIHELVVLEDGIQGLVAFDAPKPVHRDIPRHEAEARVFDVDRSAIRGDFCRDGRFRRTTDRDGFLI